MEKKNKHLHLQANEEAPVYSHQFLWIVGGNQNANASMEKTLDVWHRFELGTSEANHSRTTLPFKHSNSKISVSDTNRSVNLSDNPSLHLQLHYKGISYFKSRWVISLFILLNWFVWEKNLACGPAGSWKIHFREGICVPTSSSIKC